MNKHSILTLAALAAFAVCAPFTVSTANAKPAAAAEKANKAIPYHGTVASVDATAKTFTIKGKQKDRVFSITDKTTITNSGAAADITAITAGAEVRGQATKSGDTWEAVKVMLGPKEAKGTAKGGAKKDEAKPADAAPAAPAPAPAAPAADATPAAPAAPADAAPAK